MHSGVRLVGRIAAAPVRRFVVLLDLLLVKQLVLLVPVHCRPRKRVRPFALITNGSCIERLERPRVRPLKLARETRLWITSETALLRGLGNLGHWWSLGVNLAHRKKSIISGRVDIGCVVQRLFPVNLLFIRKRVTARTVVLRGPARSVLVVFQLDIRIFRVPRFVLIDMFLIIELRLAWVTTLHISLAVI
jgi:hypothetical protein